MFTILHLLMLMLMLVTHSSQLNYDLEGEKTELIARGFSGQAAIGLVRIGEQHEVRMMATRRNETERKKVLAGAKLEMETFLKSQSVEDQELFEQLFISE